MSVNKFKDSNIYGNFNNYDLSGGNIANATFQRNVTVGGLLALNNVDISGNIQSDSLVVISNKFNLTSGAVLEPSGTTIGIGNLSGDFSTVGNTVALGQNIGADWYVNGSLGTNDNVVIGSRAMAGQSNEVSIGSKAGGFQSRNNSVRIGYKAGYKSAAGVTVIGSQANSDSQSNTNSTSIGCQSGCSNQAGNCLALGYQAGYSNQEANTIILNATGGQFNGAIGVTGACFINPIRNTGTGTNAVLYNPTTSEVSYGSLLAGATGSIGATGATGSNGAPTNTYVIVSANTTVTAANNGYTYYINSNGKTFTVPIPTATQMEYKIILPARVFSCTLTAPTGYGWVGPFGATSGLTQVIYPGTYRIVSTSTNWMVFPDNITPFSYAYELRTLNVVGTEFCNQYNTPLHISIDLGNSSGGLGYIYFWARAPSGTYTASWCVAIVQPGQFGYCNVIVQPNEYFKFTNTTNVITIRADCLCVF